MQMLMLMLRHLTVRPLSTLLSLMSYEYLLFAEDISNISGDTTGINNAVSAASNVPNNIRYEVMGFMELVMFMLLMLVMSMC
jgi:hypothetical protein